MDRYNVLGLMSGTSLDGVDLAYCELVKGDNWDYKIHAAETIPYPEEWIDRLRNAYQINGVEITRLDREYGQYLGELSNRFLKEQNVSADLIASHGHTIFHQPENSFTLQIGHGASLKAATGITTIYDFRSQDVAMGGQGAPLVPIGDQTLFAEYAACLNLGGFANISIEENGARKAWDICAVNTVLNALAGKLGLDFDNDGKITRSGNIDSGLLAKLKALEYYKKPSPKSLGMEWVEQEVFPLLDASPISIEDKLCTYTVHIAEVLATDIQQYNVNTVLVTGGGAYNSFMIEKLVELSTAEIIIPEPTLIEYKEALVFALLGVLRLRNEVNVLASVTGATQDHSSGIII